MVTMMQLQIKFCYTDNHAIVTKITKKLDKVIFGLKINLIT